MTRGGARPGAGRPKGQGKYGEATVPMRVPQSLAGQVGRFVAARGYRLPLYASPVAAGYPAAAEDHIDARIDLAEALVPHPASSFLLRVRGDSMVGAGIHEGDMLVVDRSIAPTHGKVVVAAVDGEPTVKRLWHRDGMIRLLPENEAYPVIEIPRESALDLLGVVTSVIHPL